MIHISYKIMLFIVFQHFVKLKTPAFFNEGVFEI